MEKLTFEPNVLNLDFIEARYADFRRDPSSVPADWRQYFEQMPHGNGPKSAMALGPTFRRRSVFNPTPRAGAAEAPLRVSEMATLQHRVDQLIRNYRVRGHIVAQLDPLGTSRPQPPELDPAYHGFTEKDFDIPFSTEFVPGADVLTLRQIVERLRNTYCRSIGAQFMHIDDLAVRNWLQERMEGTENRLELSRDEQLRILTRLTDAVIFEEFIQKKFTGAKSFSLEGAESLIPLLDLAIEKAGEQGINEIVIGMAHRGRLNVLANVIGKNPRQIFREFEDIDAGSHIGGGDVKYHLGYHNDWMTACGHSVHLALCFNPSHLEFVNPVALGRMRAKQDRMGDLDRDQYMVLLIHGDAAFAGEGIVQETLNLSELDGYKVGGTLHVIVNNQLGFTTTPDEGRSSGYATDVAKMLQIPIFHVNGEDPEAVAQVVKLAMEFRREFGRDVVIDMYCYRRRGHNEGDEPSFTQPVMYRAIQQRESVRQGYLEHLLTLDGVTAEEAEEIVDRRHSLLEQEFAIVREADQRPRPSVLGRVWKGYHGGPDDPSKDVNTSVERQHLVRLLELLNQLPEGFHLHPKLERWMEQRRHMARGEKPLDWSAAEALALGTLAVAGTRVRLSGQDSGRGTFSHRHTLLHDYEDGHTYMPLQHLAKNQAPIEVINSPLSEAGVLGFEYGYSGAFPDALVLWEAQFGDFCNAGQVIIDQFIASGEDKWGSLSGLVLLLPHGFEGMGPEHSSARLERFLLLASEDNIQVAVPSTPAQFFHLLRRQALRAWRKPLIVMTPKSLLRHPAVVSPLEAFTDGRFQRVLADEEPNRKAVRRVLLCCGKIYYELAQERREHSYEDVAILRVEQLYPLPPQILESAFASYPPETSVVWVQEEPENMGAWRHLYLNLGGRLLGRFPFTCVARIASASPATGSAGSHKLEQKELIARAFAR
ncbi:MAG: 2-oxoglutarate dehydrogenase E1 component [Candidatus Hydrogenedentes bacterium]|nr:2-oxoglutarate dehydrogenase E1 component [Candidatus Hydrogenedentota bacterium]